MQHVQVPHQLIELKRNGSLEQGDQVIFAVIKKYMNAETRECFPSLTTIAAVLDCSRTKVLSAINRLCAVNLLRLVKEGRGKKNRYYFPQTEFDNFFEMFTEEFLKLNMPLNIKEYYMSIQQYLYGKETGVGRCSYSNVELAEKTGLSPLSVKKYNTWLINNGFLEEELTNKTDEAGLAVVQKNFNLNVLQQAALWVQKVNEQLSTTMETVEAHDEKIESLEKKVALLEKELAKQRNSNLYKALPEEFSM